MRVTTGSYVGDGGNPRAISGVGFQPNLLIVKGDGQNAIFLTASMVAAGIDALQYVNAAVVSILSLDANGFTINNSALVNSSGVTYRWVAVYDDGAGDYADGVYAGDGVAGRLISTGFAQKLAVAKFTGGTAVASFRITEHDAGSASFFSAAAETGARITGFTSSGFNVASDININGVGRSYAWYALGGVAVETGVYTGDAVDDRLVSATTPLFATVKAATNAAAAVFRTDDYAADSAALYTNAANAANRIQSFELGGFVVGTDSAVNGSGINYKWFALHDPAPASVIAPIMTDYRRRRTA